MEPQVTTWVGVIAQVGFPIAVASYVLFRLEKQVQNLTKAVNGLKTEIMLLLERIPGQ